ncbi:hypothetical protein QBC37DRAFT_483608 [Rhypophila decipiens]|uniref:Uncharacterized protein n=1 Tax=Rhypophila decipiens TaxID=261697 RepID=A0AAN6Y9Y5_9PEZI|nr:hypothetical protein QBC37DRAFT_483608 [Rhypophila decipiens]
MFSEALGADLASRAAFASTCRRINQAVEPGLYKDEITWNDGYCIIWAAEKGQVQTMQKCIAGGGDIFRRFVLSDGYSPGPLHTLLHLSARVGMDHMVAFLLDQGFDIHTEARGVCADSAAVTSLQHSPDRPCMFMSGQSSTARLLISRGALNHPTDPLLPRKAAIRAAASFGLYDIFPDIIKGRKSEVPAIIGAAPRSDLDILNRRGLNTFHYGALHHACGSDSNIQTIRALIEHGADPNERIAVLDPTKGTPLSLAGTGVGPARVVHVLMDLGANPEMLFAANDQDFPTKTLGYILHRILYFDIDYEKVPTEEITRRMLVHADRLIQNGANLFTASRRYSSLISGSDVLKGFLLPVVHCTYYDCAPMIMDFLVKQGVHVDEYYDGNTALTTLVQALESGLDLDPLSTPSVERRRRLFEGIKVLLEHGACVLAPGRHHHIQGRQYVIDRFFGRFPDPFDSPLDPNTIKLVLMFLQTPSKCRGCSQALDGRLREWLDRRTVG